MNVLSEIDKNWTLFLDRDGVINHEKKEDYILSWSEFSFYEGVMEALQTFSDVFGTIVIVTNQRGVGKGVMSVADLEQIHSNMMKVIIENNGRIDKIYYCSAMNNDCNDRKPNPGMAFQAKADFKQIDFKKSIMVGNKLTDMQFGKNAGMHTVYVDTTHPEVASSHPLIDLRFNDLFSFAKALQSVIRKA